ncbi:MAG: protein-L-isoaspartate(D-aspartate) O-methyltransferase [Planctomycetota bacterium]
MSSIDFQKQRELMVQQQITSRGIEDPRVLSAMRAVPREEFLDEAIRERAYIDAPLRIASGQTISQPYIVALMTEALQLGEHDTVLEVGTGSGYAAAILAEVAAVVYSIERIEELAVRARTILQQLGYQNIHVCKRDGTQGWPEHAPFDGIVVAAGGPKVPETLKQQLKIGGRLILPVGSQKDGQQLLRITRVAEHRFNSETLANVQFVPLIGAEGWEPVDHRKRGPVENRPSTSTAEDKESFEGNAK